MGSALKRSKVQVVYNFGREDAANREALGRLIASVTRFLDPDAERDIEPPRMRTGGSTDFRQNAQGLTLAAAAPNSGCLARCVAT